MRMYVENWVPGCIFQSSQFVTYKDFQGQNSLSYVGQGYHMSMYAKIRSLGAFKMFDQIDILYLFRTQVTCVNP